MKGGLNKLMRNIVAGASDTEFEKVSPWFSNFVEADESHVPYGQQGAKGKARYL